MRSTKFRTIFVAGALGATVAIGATAFTASAATTSDTTKPSADKADRGRQFTPPTDAQRKCLEDAGFKRPESRPAAPPTEAQRAAFQDAAKKCGIELPKGGLRRHHRGRPMANLTDAQRKCLTDAGVTRPEGRPTQEQIDKLRAAAKSCGIEIPSGPPEGGPGFGGDGPGGPGGPGHGPMVRLTDTQRTCLQNSGLTRPDGPPTDSQRQAFQDTAKKCGIELPSFSAPAPEGAGSST